MIDYDSTKRTGGRWYVSKNSAGVQVRAEDGTRDVAVFDAIFGSDAQRAANAAFAAEARAMVEALREASYYLTGRFTDPGRIAERAAYERKIAAILARIDGEG